MALVDACVLAAISWVILFVSAEDAKHENGHTESRSNSPVRIGIVGGGIGGCAASWFLRQEFPDVEVVLFEKGVIGGRVSTVELNGHEFEAGGSIFHEKNKILQDFLAAFGLKSRADDSGGEITAVTNGAELLFESTGWLIMDAVKAVWRYGLSPLKLRRWVDDYVSRFTKIYALQARNCSYLRPAELLLAADAAFGETLRESLKDRLRTDGFAENFIREMVEAATRVNYNQRTTLPTFVGSVSLAGMVGPLHSVRGGNHQVPIRACETASVIVNSSVSTIELLPSQQIRLHTSDTVQDFDYVILAAPLQRESVNVVFKNFPAVFQPSIWIGSYQSTVATFVEGEINSDFFGSSKSVDIIINVAPEPIWSSVGRLKDVHGNTSTESGFPVWKIFSTLRLQQSLIDEMFLQTFGSAVVNWKAYPNYGQPPRHPPPFNLYGRLYYLNAVEWVGSAMEMSLIAAKNIVLDIAAEIRGVHSQNCPVMGKTSDEKLEL